MNGYSGYLYRHVRLIDRFEVVNFAKWRCEASASPLAQGGALLKSVIAAPPVLETRLLLWKKNHSRISQAFSMRLLQFFDNGEFCLTNFPPEEVPFYGILSHRWGNEGEEVTYEDLKDGRHNLEYADLLPGYRKIQFCYRRGAHDGLRYFWIDTCCTIQTHHRRQCPTKRVAYAAENGGRMYIAS